MRSLALHGTLPLLCAVALIGCGQNAAVSPTTASQPDSATASHPDAPGVLGIYEFALQGTPEGMTGQLSPVREATELGDSYMIDASRYFNGAPCGDCVKLNGIALTANNELALRIEIRHPFPMPLQPLGPNARLDLHLFDVAGTMVLPTTGTSFSGIGRVAGPVRLLNPDGYSGLFDAELERLQPTIGTALHPYKIFNVDDTTGSFHPINLNGFENLFAPTGYNVFPQGARGELEFVLRMPAGTSTVGFRETGLFIVTANWGAASNNQKGIDYLQRANPAYFLPEFNQKSSWRIRVTTPVNTLKADEPTSAATIQLEVADWQFGAIVDGGFPNPAQLGSIKAASEASQIRLEIPGLLSTPVSIDPASGIPNGLSRTYSTGITNTLEAESRTYLGLVEVIDGRTGTEGIAQDNPTPFAMGTLATYQLFEIAVAPPTSTGSFGPAKLVTIYESTSFVGNFNTNSPEMVTNGEDLYFAYESLEYKAVLARSVNGGNLFVNLDIIENTFGDLTPTLGPVYGSDTMHLLLVAPVDPGLFSTTSFNNGTDWAALKLIDPIVDWEVDSLNINAAPDEATVAVYGFTYIENDLYQMHLDSAKLPNSSWVAGASISNVHPYNGPLYRVDEEPGLVRLSDGTVVCVFATNARSIETTGDEGIFEPVAVRTTNDGTAWQGWNYVHALPTSTQPYNSLCTVVQNDIVYVLESDGDRNMSLYKSASAGASWTPVALPATLPQNHSHIAEVAADRGTQLAVIYSPYVNESWDGADLFVIESTDAGDSWGEPVRADADPDGEYAVTGACGVYTDDGKLHVSFIDTRQDTMKWWVVNEE